MEVRISVEVGSHEMFESFLRGLNAERLEKPL